VNEALVWLNSHGNLVNGNGTLNLDSTYTYNNEGKVTAMTYPTTTNNSFLNGGPSGIGTYPGASYNYSYDNMYRLFGMTTSGGATVVSGIGYNAANQLLGVTFNGIGEARGYNVLGQLTSLYDSNGVNLTYNYPTGTNNGQISSQVVSGETITYQYDSLKRLISATSSASWGENYGYDAFGSLVSKTPTAGSPPQLSQAVNPANSQIVGQTYDANGNQLSAPAGGALTYDSENRLLTAPGVQYAYDSNNKRVWAGTLDGNGNLTSQAVFVYGANGKMLGEYSITVGSSSLTVATMNLTVYFGKKRIGVTNSSGVTTAFSPDRLGSSGQYYPYGEGKGGNSPADTWSFATYWRDSATGLDYANQRYSSNQFGRFMTPDPYRGSAQPQNPQSWNRYGYVLGDPVNSNDPTGEGNCTSASSFAGFVYGGDPQAAEADASTSGNADNTSGCSGTTIQNQTAFGYVQCQVCGAYQTPWQIVTTPGSTPTSQTTITYETGDMETGEVTEVHSCPTGRTWLNGQCDKPLGTYAQAFVNQTGQLLDSVSIGLQVTIGPQSSEGDNTPVTGSVTLLKIDSNTGVTGLDGGSFGMPIPSGGVFGATTSGQFTFTEPIIPGIFAVKYTGCGQFNYNFSVFGALTVSPYFNLGC